MNLQAKVMKSRLLSENKDDIMLVVNFGKEMRSLYNVSVKLPKVVILTSFFSYFVWKNYVFVESLDCCKKRIHFCVRGD